LDFHSHLIPGIDDGVKDVKESLEILKFLSGLGFEKIITTPHIYKEYFPNTEEAIRTAHAALNSQLGEIDIQLEIAAEYFVDEDFANKVSQGHDFLTLGQDFILIETSFVNKPFFLNEVIFELQSKGYRVILAHPERYLYLQEHLEEVERLKKQGVYFQVNLGSMVGYYSNSVKKFSEELISLKYVDFVGSDFHNRTQKEVIYNAIRGRLYRKLMKLPVLNDTLIK
jgi:tyrosine-protein phosphatase YwqE